MNQKHAAFKASILTTGLFLGAIISPGLTAVANPLEPKLPENVITIAEATKEDAQHYVAPSTIKPVKLERGGYSATTKEEVDAIEAKRAEKKRAEEAKRKAEAEAKRAEEAKRVQEEARAAARSNNSARVASAASRAIPKMSGEFAWPLTEWNSSYSRNSFRTAARPDHKGYDMMTSSGTPIFAAHDGRVMKSSETSNGYGVVVMIETVIDGKRIYTVYAHMTYGTRLVEVGDTVKAGDPIGAVGQTGRATAPHLHFEVNINGVFVNPEEWLKVNLGSR